MYRTGSVGVVWHLCATELVDTFAQIGCVCDASVNLTRGDAGGARDEELVVVGGKTLVSEFSDLQRGERGGTSDALCFRTASQSWRKRAEDALGLGAGRVSSGAGCG